MVFHFMFCVEKWPLLSTALMTPEEKMALIARLSIFLALLSDGGV